MLVMDEVDRMLDMGFKQSVDQILINLNKNRQTLLFSATVSNKLKDIARCNLKDQHEYIQIDNFDTVHENEEDAP
jgi:ATP-dependent RNA helicase DDX10/DBP4